MDRTLGAGEGGNRAAGALCDDLRHDRDRRLLGRAGSEIETDRRSEAIKAGLVDTGTSGKMRIHTRPARRMWRVIARRAASIWRAVIRAGLVAFKP